MANRDTTSGPVVFKLPTLDPKVVRVIHQRFPNFIEKNYDAHYQVSYSGHGYADVFRVDGQWCAVVYKPGGKYRCTGGVHKKYKDAIEAVSNLLKSAKVAA